MTLHEKIVQLSSELLAFLLQYRKTHPGFRFWLRSREHNKAKDQGRLKSGQWFQGSDYIFLSFHSASGHVNMTRSIGWVVEFDTNLNPVTSISLVWPKEQDQRKIDTYLDIIQTLGGFDKLYEVKYKKRLPEKDVFESLTKFLDETLPQINAVIEKHGMTKEFTIPEEKFLKRLNKVLEYQAAIKEGKPLAMEDDTDDDATFHSEEKQYLNTILYGPPGTGKTYHTINKALQIIDPKFHSANRQNRSNLHQRFRELHIKDWNNPTGQIGFVTFHQSLSYEDFVEGIKPEVIEAGNDEDAELLTYQVKDGLFKLIAQKATWRSGNFDGVIESFKSDYNELESKPALTIKSKYTTFDVAYRGTTVFYVRPHNSKKENAWYPVSIVNLRKVYETGNYEGVYNPTYIREILDYLKKNKGLVTPTDSSGAAPIPHVLIIDEINRGNVSQIFGELITLLEPDKRSGEKEELEVFLPYSKKPFKVPSNLYIIGTMNTADRSVEALDTALRRRFTFEEVAPQPLLLNSYQRLIDLWVRYKHTYEDDEEWIEAEQKFSELHGMSFTDKKGYEALKPSADNIDEELTTRQPDDFEPVVTFNGVDLEMLLTVINNRLELLLTADHKIGHAWFMDVFSLSDLKAVFSNQILPLLQEFFYNDYSKIGLVIGKAFFEEATKFDLSVFATFPQLDNETKRELAQKPVYRLRIPPEEELLAAFQSIYTPTA